MPSRVGQLMAQNSRTETPSDLLAEVHIYVVPHTKWIPYRRLAKNQVVEETVSVGFVRVPPDTTLTELRAALRDQLPGEELLQHYVFIKSIGRNFTQVKPYQEGVMKVKSFLPPKAPEPEIHILELSEELLRNASSLGSLVLSDELSDSQVSSALGRTPRGGGAGTSGAPGARESWARRPSRTEGPLTEEEEETWGARGPSDASFGEARRLGTKSRVSDDDDSGSSDVRHTTDRYGSGRRGSARRDRAKPKNRSKKSTGDEGGRNSEADSEKGGESGGLEADDETSDLNSRPESKAQDEEQWQKSESHRDEQWQRLQPDDELVDKSEQIKGEQGQVLQAEVNESIQAKRIKNLEKSNDGIAEGDKENINAGDQEHLVKRSPTSLSNRDDDQNFPDDGGNGKRFAYDSDNSEEDVYAHSENGEPEKPDNVDEVRRSAEELVKDSVKKAEAFVVSSARSDTTMTRIDKETKEDNSTVKPGGKQSFAGIRGRKNRIPLRRSRSEPPRRFGPPVSQETSTSRRHPSNFGRSGPPANNRSTSRRGQRVGRGGSKPRGASSFRDNADQSRRGVPLHKEGDRQRGRRTNDSEGSYVLTHHSPEEATNYDQNPGHKNATTHSTDDIPQAEVLDVEQERRKTSKSSDGFEVTYDIDVNNGVVNITPREAEELVEGTKRAWGSAVSHNEAQGDNRAAIDRRTHTNKQSKKEKTTPDEEEIKREMEAVVEERKANELRRKKLFEMARRLHDTIVEIKEKRREQWWVQYTAARRHGTALEEQQAALRSELDQLHRKIIGSIVKRSPLVTGVRDEPSRKANLKISVIRLRHEIEDLKKRHESMDIKLETETKLKGQAEKEVKQLRQEVSKKKVDVALIRAKNPSLTYSMGDIPQNF